MKDLYTFLLNVVEEDVEKKGIAVTVISIIYQTLETTVYCVTCITIANNAA